MYASFLLSNDFQLERLQLELVVLLLRIFLQKILRLSIGYGFLYEVGLQQSHWVNLGMIVADWFWW